MCSLLQATTSRRGPLSTCRHFLDILPSSHYTLGGVKDIISLAHNRDFLLQHVGCNHDMKSTTPSSRRARQGSRM